MVRAILETCGLPKNTPGTNIRVNELLHEAIRVAPDCPDTPEMVKLLIDYGVESVNNGWEGSPLNLLMRNRRGPQEKEVERLEIAKMLLTKGARMNEVDENGGTACIYAAIHGLSGILGLLMKEESFDINEMSAIHLWCGDSDSEYRMLHLASRYRHVAIVKMLIDKGADTNVKTTQGRTALHFCLYNVLGVLDAGQGLEIAKILIANGADVKARTFFEYEWSPFHEWSLLHILAETGDSAVAISQLLLENGADVNIKDHPGRNPLPTAVLRKVVAGKKFEQFLAWGEDLKKVVEAESIGVVKLLLDNGAEVDAKMENGCTA